MSGLVRTFPDSWGSHWASCVDHAGPASYTQVSTGSPPTGGDTVQAAEFGMKELYAVIVVGSDDGQYDGVAFVPGNPGQPSTSAVLLWAVAHTGAEASASANLSARTMRLIGIGL